jgi:hypothetical protein
VPPPLPQGPGIAQRVVQAQGLWVQAKLNSQRISHAVLRSKSDSLLTGRTMVADGAHDESFNFVRGHPSNGSGALSLSLEQGRGDLIPIPQM